VQVPAARGQLRHERRWLVLHQAVDHVLPLPALLPRQQRLAGRHEGTARLKF
jgi:hypothetical protein